VVANDLALFAAAYPSVTAVGPLLNNLSRGGERLLLRDAAGNVPPKSRLEPFKYGRMSQVPK